MVLGAMCFMCPAFGADAPTAPDSNSVRAPHKHGSGTELIKMPNIKHLETRLSTAPHVLREQCKYESVIPTPPPIKEVALSFDDGPEPGQTEHILDVLKRHDIPAIFFVLGRKAKDHPELIEMIRADGKHLIGNHSWNHSNFHSIDEAAQAMEVKQTREYLPSAGPNYFRYPYGNSTCETNTLLHSMGYGIIGWHIDSCDWAFDHSGSVDEKDALICGVLPQHRRDYVGHVVSTVRARSGGIVLLHEIHPNTVKQLENIIVALRAEGFVFKSLTEPGFASSVR